MPGLVVVGVGAAQAGGVRADRAVGEQVAGGAQRAQLAGPVDATELAPVADDVRPGLRAGQGEHGAEVVLARRCPGRRARAAADAERCRALAGRPLRARRCAGGDRLAGHPAYDVVRVPASGARSS